MIVRQARAEDVPALAAIAGRAYREAFKTILEEEALASRDAAFFEARFTSDWGRMLVVASADKPVGFLLMTEGHIDMLFMEPDASGKGGGALLLRHAEERGARSLECFRDNASARRFYERHGWQVTRDYEREFAGRSRSFVLYEKN